MNNITTEDLLRTFSELLIRSEKRIDRTNDMIDKMAHTIEENTRIIAEVTREYSSQLDKMQVCRDRALIELQRLTELLIEKEKTSNTLLSILRDIREKNSTQINVN